MNKLFAGKEESIAECVRRAVQAQNETWDAIRDLEKEIGDEEADIDSFVDAIAACSDGGYSLSTDSILKELDEWIGAGS